VDYDPALQPEIDRFMPIHSSDFLPSERHEYRIKGLIPMTGLGLIYGQFASGKSFFSLDLSVAMAAGYDWQGRATKQSKVVYIVAEGVNNFRDRYEAYVRHHNLDRDEVDISFVIQPPNLLAADGWFLGRALEASGGADVIVFDTLSQCMPGGDENTSGAMTQIVVTANELARQLNAFVILVTHAGKDSSKGVRGHTSLPAAADLIISTKSSASGCFEAEVAKRKDGVCGETFGFTIIDIEIGIDDEGEARTAGVCIHSTPHAKGLKPKWGKWQSAVIEAITLEGNMHLESLVLHLKDKYPSLGGTDKRRDSIQRAIANLVKDGYVEVKDGHVCLADPTA
jgi:putative DNA primase/helicase